MGPSEVTGGIQASSVTSSPEALGRALPLPYLNITFPLACA
jgi:hypothetical protein